MKGQPGYLCIEFFSLSGAEEWKRVKKRGENFRISLSEKGKVYINLRNGVISFPSAVSAVTESIALGFSIAVLRHPCQPITSTRMTDHTKPSVMMSSQEDKTRRIRCEDLALVVAAGFYATSVSNNAYIKHNLGMPVVAVVDAEVVEDVEVVVDVLAVVVAVVVVVVADRIMACLLTKDELKG